jgi:hypothetical protein
MTWNEGIKTLLAGEDLEARRRVKIKSGTTTTPAEVVYADAGEDFIGVTEYAVKMGEQIAVKLNSSPGTFEVECDVDSAINRGTVLYGANDGKVSDAASGTAQAIAFEDGEDGAIIEVAFWNVKSTTAATTSISDAGSHFSTTEGTVEAALQKLAKTIVIPLPRFTGWTKDGADKTIALPALELPVPVIVKRAYANLGTAPGTGKTLALKLNDTALLSIAEAATQGEAEDLAIAVAKDTDFVIKANETSGGTGANCDIILIAQVDDGE